MKLRHLFLVGFLGTGLVGCSSSAVKENNETASEKNTQSGQATVVPAQTETATTGLSAEQAAISAAEQAKLAKEKLQQDEAVAAKQMAHFDFNQSTILPASYGAVKTVAEFMQANPKIDVTVEGYCDDRGTQEYNLALGERRAKAVKNALVAEGISPDRIKTVSFGKLYPLDPANNPIAWALNRRAQFKFNGQLGLL